MREKTKKEKLPPQSGGHLVEETESKDEKLLRKKKARREFFRTVKYFIVAGSAGAIQIGTFTLFNEVAHWNYWLSYIISLIISVVWNFTINRKVTFKSANNVPIAMTKVFVYYLIFSPLSTWWTGAINGAVTDPSIEKVVAYSVEVCTILTNGITEFLYQRFFVFGKSIDQTVKTKRGEIGEFGELYVEAPKFSGDEIYTMLTNGVDIANMTDKAMAKWLKKFVRKRKFV